MEDDERPQAVNPLAYYTEPAQTWRPVVKLLGLYGIVGGTAALLLNCRYFLFSWANGQGFGVHFIGFDTLVGFPIIFGSIAAAVLLILASIGCFQRWAAARAMFIIACAILLMAGQATSVWSLVSTWTRFPVSFHQMLVVQTVANMLAEIAQWGLPILLMLRRETGRAMAASQ